MRATGPSSAVKTVRIAALEPVQNARIKLPLKSSGSFLDMYTLLHVEPMYNTILSPVRPFGGSFYGMLGL